MKETFASDFLPSELLMNQALAVSEALHTHLCPRQLLGVRMGLFGVRMLGLWENYQTSPYDNPAKRLLTIIETDGCGADGLSAAVNCWVGRRTLRIVDYGKMAATMVDRDTGRSIRIAPRTEARTLALQYAPNEPSPWHAYLKAYRLIPDRLLLTWEAVILQPAVDELISQPGLRAICQRCGEEIMNGRELSVDDSTLCQHCAMGGYYHKNYRH